MLKGGDKKSTTRQTKRLSRKLKLRKQYNLYTGFRINGNIFEYYFFINKNELASQMNYLFYVVYSVEISDFDYNTNYNTNSNIPKDIESVRIDFFNITNNNHKTISIKEKENTFDDFIKKEKFFSHRLNKILTGLLKKPLESNYLHDIDDNGMPDFDTLYREEDVQLAINVYENMFTQYFLSDNDYNTMKGGGGSKANRKTRRNKGL
jgi:hypothetical protein